jgi:hypothetical protein
MSATAITVKDLEDIKTEGLKALKDKLGAVGMIKFIQIYSNGNGDYTQDKNEYLKNVTIEDFDNFMKRANE